MVRPEDVMVPLQTSTQLTPVDRYSMPSDGYESGCVCTELSAGSERSISMLSLSMLLCIWCFTRNSICNGARCTYPSAISMQLQHNRSRLPLPWCGGAFFENQSLARFGRTLYRRWYSSYSRELRLEKQVEATSDLGDLRLLPSVAYARNELVRV
jgi:hypothetical protein